MTCSIPKLSQFFTTIPSLNHFLIDLCQFFYTEQVVYVCAMCNNIASSIICYSSNNMWSFKEDEGQKKRIITNKIIGLNITVYVVANKNYVSFNDLAKFYLNAGMFIRKLCGVTRILSLILFMTQPNLMWCKKKVFQFVWWYAGKRDKVGSSGVEGGGEIIRCLNDSDYTCSFIIRCV